MQPLFLFSLTVLSDLDGWWLWQDHKHGDTETHWVWDTPNQTQPKKKSKLPISGTPWAISCQRNRKSKLHLPWSAGSIQALGQNPQQFLGALWRNEERPHGTIQCEPCIVVAASSACLWLVGAISVEAGSISTDPSRPRNENPWRLTQILKSTRLQHNKEDGGTVLKIECSWSSQWRDRKADESCNGFCAWQLTCCSLINLMLKHKESQNWKSVPISLKELFQLPVFGYGI